MDIIDGLCIYDANNEKNYLVEELLDFICAASDNEGIYEIICIRSMFTD